MLDYLMGEMELYSHMQELGKNVRARSAVVWIHRLTFAKNYNGQLFWDIFQDLNLTNGPKTGWVGQNILKDRLSHCYFCFFKMTSDSK